MGLNLDLLTQVWEWISGICISASSSGGCDRRAKCSREELPHYRGHWQKLGGPHAPKPKARGRTGRSNPTPEARGGGKEDQLHVQGVVAAWVQEGLEELSHLVLTIKIKAVSR